MLLSSVRPLVSVSRSAEPAKDLSRGVFPDLCSSENFAAAQATN
ncbi:hypothetical protein J2R99_002208 [Rhodopseudomonas julia]|uniref:Uncharacterized protein n=1 Tax=Rhodopseudomonas julia TaxID=200617 RepID=A0ABU0C744_9BRAD|nr:hypothetical protein [Rhodopseudomonas julia]